MGIADPRENGDQVLRGESSECGAYFRMKIQWPENLIPARLPRNSTHSFGVRARFRQVWVTRLRRKSHVETQTDGVNGQRVEGPPGPHGVFFHRPPRVPNADHRGPTTGQEGGDAVTSQPTQQRH